MCIFIRLWFIQLQLSINNLICDVAVSSSLKVSNPRIYNIVESWLEALFQQPLDYYRPKEPRYSMEKLVLSKMMIEEN